MTGRSPEGIKRILLPGLLLAPGDINKWPRRYSEEEREEKALSQVYSSSLFRDIICAMLDVHESVGIPDDSLICRLLVIDSCSQSMHDFG
jgi:hypothetical protein